VSLQKLAVLRLQNIADLHIAQTLGYAVVYALVLIGQSARHYFLLHLFCTFDS
jgi:hypothetical protein